MQKINLLPCCLPLAPPIGEAARTLKNVRCWPFWRCSRRRPSSSAAFFIPVAQNLRIHFYLYRQLAGRLDRRSGGGVGLWICGGHFRLYHPSHRRFLSGLHPVRYAGSAALRPVFLPAKISIPRIFLCKLSVNVLVNILLGSLWSAMLYSKGVLLLPGQQHCQESGAPPVGDHCHGGHHRRNAPHCGQGWLARFSSWPFTEKWQAAGS